MSLCPATLGLAALLFVAALSSEGGEGAPPAKGGEAGPEQIQRLIKALGSDSFRERDEAAQKLAAMDEALPALRKAQADPRQEVRTRARQIIRAIDRRRAEREQQARLAWGVDGFVERMVERGKAADDGEWELVLRLAADMAAHAGRKSKKLFRLPRDESWFMRARRTVTDQRTEEAGLGPERVLAGSVSTGSSIGSCVIVSRGPVRTHSSLSESVVFANGDIVTGEDHGPIDRCIIFCDGNVKALAAYNSVILATGSVTLTLKSKSSPSEGSWICQGVRNMKEVLPLFDVAKAGAEVSPAEGGVRVEKIHAGRPLAAAGLQVGDVVLRAGEVKVRDAESFRRAVRRAAVGAGPLALRVRRGGEVLSLTAKFAK